jgi:hypothetical protein
MAGKQKRTPVTEPGTDKTEPLEIEPAEPLEGDTGRNLEWKCVTCNATAPPTGSGYSSLIAHSCKDRKVWLVDKDSGEMLANNIGQAQHLGLIKKREKRETKEEKEDIKEPQLVSDGFIKQTITLPVDAYTLFNLVRAFKIEKEDKRFDAWIWDCISKRFLLDYKVQLVLAPIGEVQIEEGE